MKKNSPIHIQPALTFSICEVQDGKGRRGPQKGRDQTLSLDLQVTRPHTQCPPEVSRQTHVFRYARLDGLVDSELRLVLQ